MATLGFDLGEVTFGPDVDDRNEQRGEAEADANPQEGEARHALVKTIGVWDDDVVAR